MAILVGVLAPQFIKYVEQSRESTDLQNIEEFKTAVEALVADEGAASNITVTITKGTPATVECSADLQAYGLPDADTAINLKSSKWDGTDMVWTYDVTNYKWDTVNGKADYYNLDGTKVP